ncbi:MAG: GNAT family N-acetyltransferase [Deltaproteobacteria bacterium]|jgi:putative acetyltransferase|nr:GNAT family N-acetyltransferase [Deltaproteobacteria bacterium]
MADQTFKAIQFYPVAARTPSLLAELVELWRESVKASHAFLTPDDVLTIRPQVTNLLATADGLAVRRDPQGRTLGFLALNKLKVEALFLAPWARGQGYGRELMSWASQKGARYVDVNVDNHQALGFYRYLGFELFDQGHSQVGPKSLGLYHLRLKEGSKL